MFLRMTHKGCCDGNNYKLVYSKQRLYVSEDLEVTMPKRDTLAVVWCLSVWQGRR